MNEQQEQRSSTEQARHQIGSAINTTIKIGRALWKYGKAYASGGATLLLDTVLGGLFSMRRFGLSSGTRAVKKGGFMGASWVTWGIIGLLAIVIVPALLFSGGNNGAALVTELPALF